MAWLVMVALLRQVAPRERGSRLAAALEPQDVELPRIPELDRLERELLHERVQGIRPPLPAASGRPRDRESHGSSAAASASIREARRVRELVGDLWPLVSPDREPPRNRQAPGPGLAELHQTVESLERL